MKTAKSLIHFLFFYSWKISDVSLNIWCCSNTHGLQFFYVIRKTKKLRGSAQHGSPNVLVFNIDKTLQKNKPSHSRYVKYCFFFKITFFKWKSWEDAGRSFPIPKTAFWKLLFIFQWKWRKSKRFLVTQMPEGISPPNTEGRYNWVGGKGKKTVHAKFKK